MNEIERAIVEIVGTNYGEAQCHRETMLLAVEALREKAERESGRGAKMEGERRTRNER